MSHIYPHVREIIEQMEVLAPKWLAMDGDPIGLQVGSPLKRVKKVMVTLDVIEPVVAEAVTENVDLIIAHHPLIYTPVKRINTETSHGRTIQKLLTHDIAVYGAHTNLDVAKGGVNDLLARKIGMEDTEVLVETVTDKLKKLVVFVPESHAGIVRDAIGEAGAGFIGNYSHCTFTSPGTGSFMPQESTNPYIGEQGNLEFVNELKLETIYPASMEGELLNVLQQTHPYEEVAYDLVPLENPGIPLGIGRVGSLLNTLSLEELAKKVKKTFQLEGLRVVGDLKKPVKRVAVSGGDGNNFIQHALNKGADVYITGDIKYHVAHDAMLEGLTIIDAGHNIENVMKHGVSDYLTQWLSTKHYQTEVYVSKERTDPFRFI